VSTWQPSREARRTIDKLLVQVIDWGELNLHANTADVSFDASAEPLGEVRPDGSMVFPESIGRAFEEPQDVADFRRAIHVVTVTALNKRMEGPLDEAGRLVPRGLRLEAGGAADEFVNDGLREAYWAVNGDRICLRLSPELGPELRDAQDAPDRPVARDAALALADSYGRALHDWPDNAVRSLLRTPRDEVFEAVVDAKLASQLRDEFTPVARDALSELRQRLANGLRTGFEQLSEESRLRPGQARDQVAELLKPVDESARTVKETFTAVTGQQSARLSTTSAADQDKSAPVRPRWAGFGR
jgi:hypothetical protein